MTPDEQTKEYVESLVTDNDHLRAENDALRKENDNLREELRRFQYDREYCL